MSSTHHDEIGLCELRTRARKHMDDAMRLIPMERKAAYLEALEKAPYLFEDESDPLKFLRRCSYNIWDASERLCLYWTLRKKAFEPDRAFLPLVLTGDGALDKNDILSLQAGFPAVLPNSQTSGKQVVYCDRRQHVPSLTAANRMRGFFYLAKVLAEDERAQTDGVLVFNLVVTPRVHGMNYSIVYRAYHVAIHAMPVKFQFHMLNCLPRGSDRKLYAVQDVVSCYLRQCVLAGLNCSEDLAVYFEREDSEFLELLQDEFGLAVSGIPTALGGSWTFEESTSWCRKRALLEREKFKWVLMAARKTQAAHFSPPIFGPGGTKPATAFSSCAEERLTKKRAADVIRSRRRRERQRQEVTSLMQERDKLCQEQATLKAENVRLEDLWRRAQNEIAAGYR